MKTIPIHSFNYKRYLLVLLMGVVLIFALEITNKINIIDRQQPIPPKPVITPIKDSIDGVNYSPASDSDNEDINKKKEDGSIAPSSTPQQLSAPQVTINRLVQNADLSVTIAAESTLTKGRCSIKFVNGSVNVSRESVIENKGNYYGCKNITIERSAFSISGKYHIEVSITDDILTGEATGEITIK